MESRKGSTGSSRGASRGAQLRSIYKTLLEAYGPQHWWPGASPFEVVVGAILTQRVAWSNVERAIASLEDAGLMDAASLAQAPVDRVASLIRPCLYYNTKAAKLKAFLDLLFERHGGDLCRLLDLRADSLRLELLSVRGIGEETADAIILYAAGKPSFVVDAYTRRILSRLGLVKEKIRYVELRTLFMEALRPDATFYNEYHALLVRHGKERCRPRPLCAGCPLLARCSFPDATKGTPREEGCR
jgi:endonuclease-3 related protein